MLDLDPQTRTWLLAGLSGIAVSGGVFVTNALLRILSDTPRKTTASSLAAKATKHTATSELQSNPSPDSQAAATDVVHVFYASQKGHGKRFAERLVLDLQRVDVAAEAIDLKAFDPDRLVEHTKAIFIVATYAGGSAVPGTEGFFSELAEMSRDFRVEKTLLSALQYAVFGCGNSEYPAKDFNAVARRLDRSLRLLGAKRLLARCEGDDIDNALSEQFDAWSPKLLRAVEASVGKGKGGGEGASKRTARRVERLRTQGALDAAKAEAGATKRKEEAERERALRSGYKIVGSHSGVKICRWTKAMLRGRGGCYKHTFYGIVSYQCMEATPSLACANKCVFCWRHHDNPVGTSFRWQVNHPTELVDGFEEKHKAMIKQMKGVPGVKPERYAEACKTVRHCALSLVGEPIIYPRINELLATLHKRGISSFMVTNAQFPAQMETLSPCTQLYISVDAPNAPELKAVDRPLFPDFWQRFLECVDLLRAKRQRTVFRMTLVNGWNTEQLSQYVELVKRGQPDFVEVKGVTYCGDSKASPLSIKHCPFHHEVRAYGQAMVAELGADYELASEHAHSNIILIAHRRFKVDGAWRTWIDYDKFTALANSGEPFDSLDYSLPTPPWAVFDEAAEDGGFDPGETRFIRKGGATTVTGGGC